VAVGEVAAGMVIDQYAQTVIEAVGSDSLVFVLPRRTTVIGPDAIGMIRGNANPDLSRLFIRYALLPEGQRLLYQRAGRDGQKFTLYRMPVVASLYQDPEAPQPDPYRYPAGLVYDQKKATRRWNTLNDLMGVWLIDAHGDLRSAWRRVIGEGCSPALVARLCAAPVTEAELDGLADAWKDSRRRLEITQRWAQEALTRYRSLARGAADSGG
jgi:ABC-type glycerol-3-phosphate transport system substrate-binding protein